MKLSYVHLILKFKVYLTVHVFFLIDKCAQLQVGDSIVRKARETLERSIQLVHDTPKWDARVVYGDTDR